MSKSLELKISSTGLWYYARALDIYSRSYDPITHEQEFSDIGRYLNEYKYWRIVKPERRAEIEKIAFEFTLKHLQANFTDEIPFNYLFSVPNNRAVKESIGLEVCKLLETNYPKILKNSSAAISKTKEIPVIKNIESVEERAAHLKDAYTVDKSKIQMPKGFLVIDDIYGSGSTVRSLGRTLRDSFPEVPRFLITLTYLKSNLGVKS